MDESGGEGPRRLVVKIPKEKLKPFENLWKKKEMMKGYQRSRSEDVGRGVKASQEGEDEEEGAKKITHFKKRIIRTHSATMPPLGQTQECPRVGLHHLPATTPTRPLAPTSRQRFSKEAPLILPKSPEISQKISNSEDPGQKVHESMEQEFAKVLNSFYIIIDTVRSTFHHNKEIIKAGLAEVESFLRMCDNYAKGHFAFEEHRVFYSSLDCMRDFTSRIRTTIYDESRTMALFTPAEENFYKNIFFRIFEYITSNSTKNETPSTINCIIWKQRQLDTGNMIVLPFIGHSPYTSQYFHPTQKDDKEERGEKQENREREGDEDKTSKNEVPKDSPKSISGESPQLTKDISNSIISPKIEESTEEDEDKKDVQKQIQQMKRKKPKYKVSEIIHIEIDSDCDSSDALDERPIKDEPDETKENLVEATQQPEDQNDEQVKNQNGNQDINQNLSENQNINSNLNQNTNHSLNQNINNLNINHNLNQNINQNINNLNKSQNINSNLNQNINQSLNQNMNNLNKNQSLNNNLNQTENQNVDRSINQYLSNQNFNQDINQNTNRFNQNLNLNKNGNINHPNPNQYVNQNTKINIIQNANQNKNQNVSPNGNQYMNDVNQKINQNANATGNQNLNNDLNQKTNENVNQNTNQNLSHNINQKINQNLSPNCNQNLILETNENINQNANKNVNQNKNHHVNQNRNHDITQNLGNNINQNTTENINPNINFNVNQNTNQHLNRNRFQQLNQNKPKNLNKNNHANLNPNKHQYLNQNNHKDLNSNKHKDLSSNKEQDLSQIENESSNNHELIPRISQNIRNETNQNIHQYINPNINLAANQNLNLLANQNINPNINLAANQNINLATNRNVNLATNRIPNINQNIFQNLNRNVNPNINLNINRNLNITRRINPNINVNQYVNPNLNRNVNRSGNLNMNPNANQIENQIRRNIELAPRILQNRTIVEAERPENRAEKTKESPERETNLHQPKRIRAESSNFSPENLPQELSSTTIEDNFRQQFPNTVISRRDGDVINDGRVVVLEIGQAGQEQRCRNPPPYPVINLPVPSGLKPNVQPAPPPYPTGTIPPQLIGRFVHLSKKDALDPIEYVKEIEALYKVPTIPDEFKHFYVYLTKVQILQKHHPVSFRLFLELWNQGGLKDYHSKFREYAMRKILPQPPPAELKKTVQWKR